MRKISHIINKNMVNSNDCSYKCGADYTFHFVFYCGANYQNQFLDVSQNTGCIFYILAQIKYTLKYTIGGASYKIGAKYHLP